MEVGEYMPVSNILFLVGLIILVVILALHIFR